MICLPKGSQEDGRDGPKVVLVSHGSWKRRFGGDPVLVGRDIRIDGAQIKVVGIMPPDFHFPERGAELCAPLAFSNEECAERDSHFLFVVARLKPGVTLERARADTVTRAACASNVFWLRQARTGADQFTSAEGSPHLRHGRRSFFRPAFLAIRAACWREI